MSVASTEQFLALLQQSNLLTAGQLESVRAEADEGMPTGELAERLIRDGLVTRWQADMLLAGRCAFFLGRYKLLSQLGQGGMGTVFQAAQTPLGRLVAVKLMARRLIKDADAMARFRREIEAVASLSHPNIVTAFDADSAGEDHFLVMEYVEGQDLRHVLKRRGRLPIGEACEYIRQAALGLQHAHERGMVHRDVKPSNLLLKVESAEARARKTATVGRRDSPLDSRLVVKVVDLGLARFAGESDEQTELTQTGQIMGTPDYISPEQARDSKHADIRSDVYSLGATLFHLLAGQVPFPGGSPVQRITARITQAPPHVQSRRPEVTAELDAVVQRMLAVDPSERYQTPAEVAAALAPFARFTADAPTSAWMALDEADDVRGALWSPPEADEADDAAAYEAFLDRLAHAADEEVTLQTTVNVPKGSDSAARTAVDGKPPPTRASKRLHKQIDEHKRADRRRLIYSLVGIAALLGLIAAYAAWQHNSRTVLVVDWPVSEREGGKIDVDGRERQLPPDGSLEFASLDLSRKLRLLREGYEPIEETWTLKRGERKAYRPEWSPTPETARRLQFAQLQRELKHVNAKQAGSGLPNDFDFSATLAIKDRIDEYNRRYGTMPEQAAAIGGLLAQLPVPADALRRDQIDPYELQVAGRGDPQKAPPELVAILGDSRLKHWNQITSVVFSPDGKTVASASHDCTVRLWDAESGMELHTFHQAGSGWASVDFSPDGTLLAAGGGGDPATITIWNVETKREHRRLSAKLISISFSPDGKLLASVSADRTVKLWNPDSGELLKSLTGHADNINCIAFSPDGKVIASCSNDKTIKLWNVASGEELRTLTGHTDEVERIAFSPDGQILASAGNHRDTTLRLWDPSTGDELRKLSVLSSGTTFLLFSPDGKSLVTASAGADGVDVWDADGTVKQRTISSREVGFHVRSAAFSRDGQALALAGYHSAGPSCRVDRLCVWNTETWRPSTYSPLALSAVDVHPDGQRLAIGSFEGSISLHDLADPTRVQQIAEDQAAVAVVRFSPNGRVLATGHDRVPGIRPGQVKLWDATTGRLLRPLPNGTKVDGVASLAFGSERALVACFHDGPNTAHGTVKMWDRSTGEILYEFDGHYGAQSVAFSRDGETFYSGGKALKALDVATGDEQFSVDDQNARSLALSPDGRILAVGGYITRLFDAETGRPLRTPRGEPRTIQTGWANALAFAPVGETLAAATAMGAVELWDAASGRLRRAIQLGPAGGYVYHVQYTPDGRHIVTANGNGTVYVLRLKEWPAID